MKKFLPIIISLLICISVPFALHQTTTRHHTHNMTEQASIKSTQEQNNSEHNPQKSTPPKEQVQKHNETDADALQKNADRDRAQEQEQIEVLLQLLNDPKIQALLIERLKTINHQGQTGGNEDSSSERTESNSHFNDSGNPFPHLIGMFEDQTAHVQSAFESLIRILPTIPAILSSWIDELFHMKRMDYIMTFALIGAAILIFYGMHSFIGRSHLLKRQHHTKQKYRRKHKKTGAAYPATSSPSWVWPFLGRIAPWISIKVFLWMTKALFPTQVYLILHVIQLAITIRILRLLTIHLCHHGLFQTKLFTEHLKGFDRRIIKRWIVWLLSSVAVGFAVLFHASFYLPDQAYVMWQLLLGLQLCALIIFVGRFKNTYWDVVRNYKTTWLQWIDPHILRSLPSILILYFCILYMVWISDQEAGAIFLFKACLMSIMIGFLAYFIHKFLSFLLETLEPSARKILSMKKQDPGMKRLIFIVRTLIFSLFYFCVINILLSVWGMHPATIWESALGQWVLGRIIKIGLLLLGGLIIWEIIRGILQAKLNASHGGKRKRLESILPLIKNTLLGGLILILCLTILSELNLNIYPLLAGAGVVGLAVGFGAQTLVKDIITGFFILVEDTVAIGDVVKIHHHEGTVESITLRTMRLRDLSGSVHTIPFSEVTTIINQTKDFSYALFDVGIAYKENVDRAIALIVDEAKKLRKDKSFKDDVIDDLDVLGVDALADSAVQIRVRMKTIPNKQWRVRRALQKRIKESFDQHHVEIPFPHRKMVHVYETNQTQATNPLSPKPYDTNTPMTDNNKTDIRHDFDGDGDGD